MTLQSFLGHGPWIPIYPTVDGFATTPTTSDGGVMDATSERVHCIGRLFLTARTGSKTLSQAGGGSITFITGAVTNANAGTVFRVGVQDVDLTAGPAARGDGTFDVHGEQTGSSIVLASTVNTYFMTSGSKTIAHGDLIAIVFQMTTRGGADSVIARQASSGVAMAFPCVTLETSGPTFTAQSAVPNVLIAFDDGTLGFIEGGFSSNAAMGASTTLNSGSTPDEYCNIFQVPFSCKVDSIHALIGVAGGTSDFELILYSDPLGTPTVVEAITCDANATGTTSARGYIAKMTTEHTLLPNTNYAIAIRPTTVNNVTVREFVSINGNASLGGLPLGANCYKATRTNQTGAFSATTGSRMFAAVRLAAMDDGVGGLAAIGNAG